jgi:hypothetical protein
MTDTDDDAQRAITNAYNNTWRRENGEHRRAYERADYDKNREARREKANQRRHEETPEQRAARAAYQREYAKSDAGNAAVLAAKARYREKNREDLRAKESARIRDENGELSAAYKKRHQMLLARKANDLETLAGRPRPLICDVCGGPPDKGRALIFDHCHARGHFRGWLCRGCNLALGNAGDNPARLRRLADYLERN